MSGRRARVPWQARIAGKLALSHLPGGRALGRRLGAFRHGPVRDPAYAYDVLADHLDKAGLAPQAGFAYLELGPGESVASAVAARALGAGRVVLVDSVREAATEPGFYRCVAAEGRRRGLAPPDLEAARSLEDVLEACHADYLTEGLASLRALPTAAFDLVLSHAVLEHVRRADVPSVLAELHRVTRPGGVGSHQIDLRDHLGGALDNLRLPERLWEWAPVAGAGFYTNRLPYPDLMAAFRAAGFRPEVAALERWPELPTPQARMAAPFRTRPEADLAVHSFRVLLHPEPAG